VPAKNSSRVAASDAWSLTSDDIAITMRRHDRTDTAIDAATGRARAAIALTYFTEQI
jgi:hypothetical protein